MTSQGYNIIDPLNIDSKLFPLIVLVDDRTHFYSWAIKWHSKGNYNHVMIMHRPGVCASQDPQGFREVEIQKYMKPNVLLKFWCYPGLSPYEKTRILKRIDNELDTAGKFWSYDWLGILGQATGIPWLNNPWRKYCSERTADIIREPMGLMIPKHSDPADMNEVFNKSQPPMMNMGYWLKD